MIDSILYRLRKLIPSRLFAFFAPGYHFLMALLGALVYRFPSRKLVVIAVTGTKGKSSVVEILNAILEEAGLKTACTNTIRFKIGLLSEENLYKMSMPGRFFMQRFLSRAVKAGCTHAILETTSQGAITYRHRFIDFDGLIFTNLAPEHIEAHGSYENYVNAKLSIADAVSRSKKKRTVLVANKGDNETPKFLAYNFTEKKTYALTDAKPYKLYKEGFDMTVRGASIRSYLSGEFNVENELAAITMAEAFGISIEIFKKGD